MSWSPDVTKWRTQSGQTFYICMLIDNFSRYIMAYNVAAQLSAKLTLDTIKEAYNQISDPNNLMLLVDGGSENNNQTVQEYLDQPAITIEKQVAMMDINFSNSMVESVFKVAKYRYWYLKNIETLAAMQQATDFMVKDYNNVRPHGSLNGLTPREAITEAKVLNFKNQLEQARKLRIEANKNNICKECEWTFCQNQQKHLRN